MRRLILRRSFLHATFVLCLALLFGPVDAGAQDLEPRKYVSVPIGQNLIRVAAGYSTGEVNISPGLPLKDGDLSMWGTSLAYVRTFGVADNASSFDAYLPYLCADGSATSAGVSLSRNVCGLGDARLRFTYNFIGAPAESIEEFAREEKELVVGASIQVYLPIGQYNDNKILNIGANRWVVRPEIGMSIPLGKWSIEFAAGVRLFGDNNDNFGDTILSQDPLYNLQTHIVYTFSPRQWLAFNANYFFGGATYQDDQSILLKQENSRAGVTWSIAKDAHNLFQVNISQGVITRVGNDSTNLSVAWLRRWE